MKNRFLSLFIALSLFAFGSAVFAETPAPAAGETAPAKKQQSPEQMFEKISADLKLTDAQKPKIKAIYEDMAKKMKELKDVPKEERKEKGKALREEQNKKMKETLTPDQYTAWQKMVEERRNAEHGDKKANK